MIAAIGAWLFDSVFGRAAAIAAGALAMWAAWLWQHDAKVADRARTEFSVRVEKEAEKVRVKAVQARKPAELPGAADRLRNHSCRDC